MLFLKDYSSLKEPFGLFTINIIELMLFTISKMKRSLRIQVNLEVNILRKLQLKYFLLGG